MRSSFQTRYIVRTGGQRVAYDLRGAGPLLVLAPGMGDLRQSYRLLAPLLADAGYTVATTDLRGHGESDAGFETYGDAESAGDLAALITELGGPAVIIGNSMSAGAAVIVAAQRPELVAGLALVGPFVRNPDSGWIKTLLFRALMARPWAPTIWRSYLPSLYAGAKPADFTAYRDQVSVALRRPGYARAFSLTTRVDHSPAAAALEQVRVPTVVIMGELDPDFTDPRIEAEEIAGLLEAEVVMVPDAGHYPHAQQPAVTAAAVLALAGRTVPHA